MKEYRIVSIVLFIGILLTGIYLCFFDIFDNFTSIVQGIFTGCIVSFVTSITQYFILKSKTKNNLYLIYLDYYREYFYLLKYQQGRHMKTDGIHQKLVEITPKLNIAIDEYSSFLGKKDKFYKLIHKDLEENHNVKVKEYKQARRSYKNFEYMDQVYGHYYREFEIILRGINNERFEKDLSDMQKTYEKMQ